MRWLDRLFDRSDTQIKTVTQEVSNQLRMNPLCSSYENLFAQVRPLIDEMKIVRPYGIGKNGAKLAPSQTREINLLESPNDEMGWAEFADLMFATWLTEPELNIHVWRQGKRVKGYTVLPVGCRTRTGTGENKFQVTTLGNGTEFYTDEEVMTLRYSRSPRAMDKGVSPATSVHVWAQIDDVLSQYQKAYFENGATPASITFITASTKEKYDSKRNKMESGLRGASNKNKTLYVWRQMIETGDTKDQVEVKPIQGNNSTMAIKEIVDIVSDRLNKSVGVSNFILGDDSSAKYDNAELSDHQFTKRRVYPALVMFWSQFQHELDRIVGGLGYGISFDLEIPELTERAKVKADITAENTDTLIKLIQAGGEPMATVRALKLNPKKWDAIAVGIYSQNKANIEYSRMAQTLANTTEEPEMVENTVEEPKPQENASTDELEHSCHCCDHKRTLDAGEEPIFAENELAEKKIYDALYALAEKEMLDKNPDVTQDEVEAVVQKILEGKSTEGATDGATSIAAQVNDKVVAGKITKAFKDDGYVLSKKFKDDLETRTQDIIGRYVDLSREIRLDVEKTAEAEAWSASQLQTALRESLPRARADMIARNETVHAFRAGGIESTKNIAKKYDLNVYLVWQTADKNACDICRAMQGKKVKAGKAFPDHANFTTEDGETVEVGWEHNYFNNKGKEPNAHANCRCTYLVEVE